MGNVTTFGQVLEAADQLSLDEQETLADIIERRRQQLAVEIRQARQEYQAGGCQPLAPDELMAKILA